MKNVLVIEDEPDVQGLLSELLARHHLSCQIAGEGLMALRLAEAQWPQVVLLDLTLPGELDGWQVWDRLLAMAGGRPLRVILFTAAVTSNGQEEARRRGAFAIAPKPVRPRQLMAVLERALEAADEPDANPDR